PHRNNSFASSWRRVAQSRLRRIESSCVSTNAATTRSCEKPLSTDRVKRFPGCRIYPWFSSTREGAGELKMWINFRPWKSAFTSYYHGSNPPGSASYRPVDRNSRHCYYKGHRGADGGGTDSRDTNAARK